VGENPYAGYRLTIGAETRAVVGYTSRYPVDQPPFYASNGEVTSDFYERTGFVIRTFLASNGRGGRSVRYR